MSSTDWSDILTNRVRHEKALAQTNSLNKRTVFEALATAGITDVLVMFDGEGDQGQLHNCVARTDGTEVEFPTLQVTLHIASWDGVEITQSEMNVADAIKRLCYDYLAEKHGGWEINEGSYGEFAFDIEGDTITLDHYARIVDVEYSCETL